MSAYIPFELQTIIMKKLPVKSLIRFRTLSKRWKSLIDSSEFITDHSLNQTQPHQLLVTYKGNYVNDKYKFVFLVDDNSFPQSKFFPTVPSTIELLMHKYMLDCSYGLVCLCGFRDEELNGLTVLWNPSIRKSVVIPTDYEYELYVVGFGVCPKTSDPMIVKILGRDCVELKAEVFRLSSRAWRSVSMNLSYNWIEHLSNQVVVDGVIYWVVFVKVAKNDDSITRRMLSFDLTSEEFQEVGIPDNVDRDVNSPFDDFTSTLLYLSKFKESLVVLNYYRAGDDGKEVCDVMMMSKTRVPNPSFTKLFTVKGLEYHIIAGFRKTGEPILRPKYPNYPRVRELGVYGLSSEQFNGIKIYGSYFQTTSYTESLLLLNHI